MKAMIDGLPGWSRRARQGVRVLSVLVMTALLGAGGAVVSAQAQEEPSPLFSEPSEGVIDESTDAPADWATFTGTGPCPEDTEVPEEAQLASRATVSLYNLTVPYFGTVQPLEPDESAWSTTTRNWYTLRNEGGDAVYFTFPGDFELALRCGHTDMSEEDWRSASVAYTAVFSFDEDSWEVAGPERTGLSLTASVGGEPRDQVIVGTSVDVTATVTPADAVGEVALYESSGPSPEWLDAAAVDGGSVSFTLDDLESGEHEFIARFTPEEVTDYTPSETESGLALTVVVPEAEETTTDLSVSPESPVDAGTEVTMTASVQPESVAGDVQFNVDGDEFGDAVALVDGEAVLTTTELPEGDLSVTASFTPDDPDAFGASTSDSVIYTVAGPEVDPPEVTAVDQDGSELGDNPVLQPGQEVTLTATGFGAEEEIAVTVDADSEDAQELATAESNGEGTAVVEFTAAGMSPGQHQLDFAGAASQLEAVWQFRIAGDGGDENGGDENGGDESGGDESGGNQNGSDDGGENGGDQNGSESGDVGGTDGGAGGTAGDAGGGDVSGSGNGGLASTGAFLIGPAVALGLAAVSAGYGFLRRSRRGELLTFDDQAAG